MPGVNFLTVYEDRNGVVVTQLKQVAKHYLKGWFCCDLVSSLPIDIIYYAMESRDSDYGIASSAKTLKSGKIVRVSDSYPPF